MYHSLLIILGHKDVLKTGVVRLLDVCTPLVLILAAGSLNNHLHVFVILNDRGKMAARTVIRAALRKEAIATGSVTQYYRLLVY